MTIICPNCHVPAIPEAIFCDECGTRLPTLVSSSVTPEFIHSEVTLPPTNQCEQCSNALLPGERFCGYCGTPISAPLLKNWAVPAPPVAPASATEYCPSCSNVISGEMIFCDFCGVDLANCSATSQPSLLVATDSNKTMYLGSLPRLVIQLTGQSLDFSHGKTSILIGREDPVQNNFPDIDLTPYRGDELGVGRKHALFFEQEGNWFIKDLDSINGTFLNKVRLQPQVETVLKDGDELKFGRVAIQFHLDLI